MNDLMDDIPLAWIQHPSFADIYGEALGFHIVPANSFERIKSMWRHWLNFTQSIGRRPLQNPPYKGLGLFASPTFPQPISTENVYDNGIMGQFFEWLRVRGTTVDLVRRGITWANHHLKAEAAMYGFGRSPHNVGEIRAVGIIMRQAAATAATRARDNGEDLQANLDMAISDEQREQLLLGVLRTDNVTLRQASVLNRLQFGAMLNRGFVTMFRAFEMRRLRFTHCSVRWMDPIGHNGGSMNPHVVTNDGKANVNGHLEYTAFACHVNALQDTAASDGCCFFQRFGRLYEEVPDFRNWRATSGLTVYRGHARPTCHVSKSHMETHWTQQFLAYDVVCSKLTHQPRVQGQQYLDNCGVSISQITRIARHKPNGATHERILTPVQQRSYLCNPPVQAVVAAAGGNWRYPQCHDPAWGKVTAEMQVLLDQLIDEMVPRLRQRYHEVLNLFNNTRSYNERRDGRLFNARGAISYIKFAMERALLMLASRPVRKINGQWTLQAQSATY
jgi:hypothetical protein